MTITNENPTTTTLELSELRDKQQKVWSSGDYNKIAAITVPLSERLIEHVGVGPDTRLLDVATGTGHAALAAARRMADVTGLDYVPALVDIARRRAEAEDVVADFVVGDAENLPYDTDSFDAVVSAIGVMFAADHPRAARELVRVCRPGGTVGLASWTAEGFVGGMLATVGKHVSPPPGAQPPTRWGNTEVVTELLGDAVTVETFTETVTQRFSSAEHFADLFLDYYGPTYAAAGRLDDDGRAALRQDLVDLAEKFNQGTAGGAVVADWEYRVVLARKN